MGMFDWAGQVGDWFKQRWHEDWHDFRKTFKESWEGLPDQSRGWWAGVTGMVTGPFKSDGDFWGSARMWLDSTIGTAGGLVGGTVGTLFQVPVLHEASWLLDKAYRYAVARPISTSWTFMANNSREAYMQGANPVTHLWENITDYEKLREAWNQSAYITPGQAIMYLGNMTVRSLGDFEASMRWADAHDPKTQAGQASFNSKDAEFWLKYGSGSLDFAGNFFADPAHGASALTKLGRLRLVDKMADSRYIAANKVHAEVGTSAYVKVKKLAESARTPEFLRDLAFPEARKGGDIANMLWTAARVSDDLYRDTYLAIRAGDREAFKRVRDWMPKIAADYADMFSATSLKDYDFQRGFVSEASGADALAKTKAEAFVDAFDAGEGIWGNALEIGTNEKMPHVSPLSWLRAGYHSFVLHRAPIIVGRPLANLLTSQGWTSMIDANDNTSIGLRQFKANLERANTMGQFSDLATLGRDLIMSTREINSWASRYGRASSDAMRQAIAMQVDDLIVTRIMDRYGISKEDIPKVLGELNRWRAGGRRIFGNQRIYMSDEAELSANRAIDIGMVERAQRQRETSDRIFRASAAGEISDEYFYAHDQDGRLNLVPLDKNSPVLRSQFAEAITMLDYRALNGALRWWKAAHPDLKVIPDPTKPFKTAQRPMTKWETGLALAAKARGFYDASVSALDAANAIWKATALLRPAQAFRNVASDTLLTFIEFGKLPLLLSAANIIPSAIRNFGPRGKLLSEILGDSLAKVRGERPNRYVSADVDVHVPGNVGVADPGKAPKYMSWTAMFADGWLSIDDYLNKLRGIFEGELQLYEKQKKTETRKVVKDKPFQLSTRTMALMEEGKGKTRAEIEAMGNAREKERQAYITRLKSQGKSEEEAALLADRYESLLDPAPRSGRKSAQSPRVPNPEPETSGPMFGDMPEDEVRAILERKGFSPEQIDDFLQRPESVSDDSLAALGPYVAGVMKEQLKAEHAAGETPPGFSAGGRPGRESPTGWLETRMHIEEPMRPKQPGDYTSGTEHISRGRSSEPINAPYTPWRVGAPYFIEYYHYKQFKDRKIDYDQLKQYITQEALRQSNKVLFTKQTWGTQLIKQLITQHLNRRNLPGYEDNPYATGTVVVDPFNGLSPFGTGQPVDMANLRDHFDITTEGILETRNIAKKKPGSLQSVALKDVHKQLVRFVRANASELLKPDTFLAMYVRADGNISIGYATAKAATVAAGATLKAGAGTRLKNFRYDGISDSGHTGFDIRDNSGRVLARMSGWAEGPNGQQLQRRVSAMDSPSTGYGALVSGITAEDQLGDVGLWESKKPRDDTYATDWERAVNAQIASDPVMQMYLKRKARGPEAGNYYTEADIVPEVEQTAWGHKWVKDMSFHGVDYVNHIKGLEGMINNYLPHPEDPLMRGRTEEVHALRAAALQKKATYEMFENLFRDEQGNVRYDDMPEVHGLSVAHAAGNSRSWAYMRRLVQNIQRQIADMPTDKWARFPFMSMAYQKHGIELAKIAALHFKDGPLPAAVVDRIKRMAQERAYHDVRYRLYDTAQRNDLAAATRLLMPFSAAMMDSYIKYGRAIRENPMLLVQGAYYWDAFERNDMVQDEQGNVLRRTDGGEHWFRVDPETGESTEIPKEKAGKYRYIQFQLPSALARAAGRKYYGVDAKPVIAINKDTMNVFLNNPGAGPLVALPANEFALSHPEFGESRLVTDYLLPFGPQSSRGKVFLPTTVRTAWDAFNAEDGDTASGQAAAIMQAELIGYGLGTRNAPPTFEEVRSKAGGLKALRFLASFASPASFQLESPYQPYVDSYRQLLADNPQTAAEEFMRLHGDEFYAVQMSVSRNNAGLSATIESSKAYDKYKALIAQYPEFGGLIVGSEGAGSFAKSVYEAQKDTPIGPGDTRTLREIMSLKESTEDLQRKTVWAQYRKMRDLVTAAMVSRGLTSLNNGGKDLQAQIDAFVEANKYWKDPSSGQDSLSPWYLDYTQSDRGAVERKFEAFRRIVADPQLQKRDDIRGLAEYLQLRDAMQYDMYLWGYKTLDSQQARGLQDRWDEMVHNLVESNHGFADLWSRWLSTDRALDIPDVDRYREAATPENMGFSNPLSISVGGF